MPAGFSDEPMITGLTQPVGVDWAPDGRAFVAEKHGVLKTAAPGASTATTVLDIRDQVNDSGDRGLEDVAVDKQFASNGYVYIAYVKELQPLVADSDSPMTSRLVRLRLDPTTGQLANPAEAPVVLLGKDGDTPCPTEPADTLDCMPADSTSHMIGTVKAMADGTLWVGNGDGASFNFADPLALRTLDPTSLAGKILHIDRQGRGLAGHPFCPSNPTLTDVCTKVHAKGFRNPFRFNVRADGKVILGDVGWNTREEIDVVDPGRSYGWPCREGTIATPGYKDLEACAPYTAATETEPVADYPRCAADAPGSTVCGSAVIGGPEYQGGTFPTGYRGSMFVGDYTGYKMFRLPPDGNGGYGPPQVFKDDWVGTDIEAVPGGDDLAYVNFGWGSGPDGVVNRISYTPGNSAPVASAKSDKTSGQGPLTVKFDGSASSDADGDTLTYDWDFGDASAHSAQAKPTHTYNRTGTFTAKLTVSDGRGRTASKSIVITVGGNAPVVTIGAPTSSTTYRDGDQVQLSGSATDTEDGTLAPSALSWQVILHHADHTHFDSSFPGVRQATFTTRRDHDADSYYEIRLTATDSQGLTNTKTVEIRPRTTTAAIASTPTGAPVSYGGRDGTAPFSATTAMGYSTTATAASAFTSGGRPFVFDRWADGETSNVRNLTVPDAGVSLRALYVEDKSRGMTATASSTEAGNTAQYGPAKAVDGDGASRWTSEWADNQYWQVDLGRRRSVDRVQIAWEAAFASRYQVLTSLDGATWTVAGETTQSTAGSRTTTFSSRVARYVRVLGLQRATQYGISFYEARVLGPADDTTPPDTSISSGPSGEVEATSASFGFAADESGSTFECKLDSGAWEGCTTPKSYPSLALGGHTFSVRATDQTGNLDASPATRSFTLVDRTAPDTSVTVGPPAGGTITSPATSFSFTSPELGATFECKVDSGSWGACTSPRSLVGLGDGSHTFAVRAKDAAGNADATPAERTFTVDTAAPETTISAGGPTGTINTADVGLAFTSEAGATFECRIDGGGWSGCTSPRNYSGLGQGSHTFEVQATDAAGNTDATPASRTFTVDTAAPDTSITDGPTGTIKTASTAFQFTATESPATFECKLDNGSWVTCGSPRTVSNLSEGSHIYSVRAKDAAGNTDASPASRTFTVDTVAAESTITVGPPTGSTILTPETSFSFTSELGATFECKLDAGAWAACSSPKDYSGLSQGSHTFQVRATDTAGNVEATPEQRTFTVDSVAPETTLASSGPSGATGVATASLSFSSEAGASFECRLDGGTWGGCTSPKTYSGLSQGPHTFEVRAKDAAGNYDPTPASRAWTVDTVAPDTSIDSGPTGLHGSRSAQYEFSSPESGAAFECRLDGGGWDTCSSPKSLSGLTDGGHTFQVRAKDAAGNQDATPASRTITVDTTVPATTITQGPTGTVTSTSATFGFSGAAAARYECKLDSGGWAGCASPKTLPSLSQGSHTFSVRGISGSGIVEPNPPTRTFTVDTVAPATTIDSGPSGTITTASASFGFTSEPGASFDCRLDGGSWQGCSSPKDLSGLADGGHTFSVRAKDAAGNQGVETSRAFAVDTRPPATSGTGTTPTDGAETPSETKPGPTKRPKTTYASTVLATRGLEAMFGLGDAGGGAVDAKGGRAGHFRGSPKRAKPLARSGRDDLARAFDGRDDRIDLDPRSLGSPRAFSVELWVKASRAKNTSFLLAAAADRSRDGFTLSLDARGRPVLSAAPAKGARASRVVGPALGASARHLAMTYDGRRLRLYVDGRLRQTSAATTLTWARARRLVVGADEKGASPFKGSLDELALYDRALTATTVKAHFSAGD